MTGIPYSEIVSAQTPDTQSRCRIVPFPHNALPDTPSSGSTTVETQIIEPYAMSLGFPFSVRSRKREKFRTQKGGKGACFASATSRPVRPLSDCDWMGKQRRRLAPSDGSQQQLDSTSPGFPFMDTILLHQNFAYLLILFICCLIFALTYCSTSV